MKDLPEFKRSNHDYVVNFATSALTHPNNPEHSHFRRLIEYDDGHYGIVFALDYFGQGAEPTKSQWNSVKKKLKRHDKRIFVFKDHATVACEPAEEAQRCGRIEFGFFAHEYRPERG